MLRVSLLTVLATLLLAAPSGAQSTFKPLPPGSVDVVPTSFLSGVTQDVHVRYRRRGSQAVVLAARFGAGRKCTAKPRPVDAGRLKAARRQFDGSFVADGRARFASGGNRICVWAREGRGGFGKPKQQSLSFRRTLLSASALERGRGETVTKVLGVASSQPLVGSYTVETTNNTPGGGCNTPPAEPFRVAQLGDTYLASLLSGAGPTCNTRTAQVDGKGGPVALALPATSGAAPLRVVQHRGDCYAPTALDMGLTPEEARAILPVVACRAGRFLNVPDPSRVRRGEPPSGRAYFALYGGYRVGLAPAGTKVDLLVDAP